ncbi:MAG: type II secretion system protein GspG [Elusimicrobia bacterium RIFOXYA1_FULL_47_7]|nr:MAG: type II secretion system protein GspG [Elusimicrobia bacterium RIFOXYA1_FULL_47_7]OGS15754.1 MAG: type II secretion system protein GspG [Elusimicrobia bacterium RIFOXYA2_FULL_47_53]OGS31055.1 MAG: type II secretion system protein GspG [Elusimicrobia bacterium RIFOXYB2_FULL_46_23]
MENKSEKKENGFTLIEILLVVAIIGILVSVVLPRLIGRTEEARISSTRLQIENIGTALDAFELDNGRFPTTQEGMEALMSRPSGVSNWKGPYLKKRIGKDAWGGQFVYISPGSNNTDYDLKSFGPNKVDGGGDDIANWEDKR